MRRLVLLAVAASVAAASPRVSEANGLLNGTASAGKGAGNVQVRRGERGRE